MSSGGQQSTGRRRGAPPKGQRRSRSDVIAAALRLVSEADTTTLTIRRLADDMGVTPMAIYAHFASKDELVAAVIDELLAEIPIINIPDADWLGRMREFAMSARAFALARPQFVHVITAPRNVTPTGLARLERIVRALCAAGLDGRSAVLVYTAVYDFAMAHAALEVARLPAREAAGRSSSYWPVRYSQVSSELYPILAANAEHFDRVTTAEHFEVALERLLASLAAEFAPERESPAI
ncbi:MAG TPA: TetR/AcrR family transcriptional regulator C-terminal domain-containing protein [Acidimicrobiales bacterium]|nr:TetR/AcrR family transcriptional regulator C-terminal domain-containing protein [Acidimicrobiales bacterium]